MKGSHKILLALLFVDMLLSNGCKPKDCHEDGTCAEDYRRMPLGEAKNYLYALPGSYWIYKNSASGDLDTQVCVGFICDTVIRKGTRNDTKHITVEYERIRRSIESSFNNCSYYDITGFYNPDAIRPLKTALERNASNSGSNFIFLHPFEIGSNGGDGFSTSTCKGVDSSMVVQGKTFYYVAKIDIDLDTVEEKDCQKILSTTYYWAKDIGVIKKVINNCNYSWELIDYNIIK